VKGFELVSTKSTTILKPDGIQPKFGDPMIALNVNMGWLIAISCIEEESVRSNPQYRRHPNPSTLEESPSA
jgi:hypothetical protein